MTWSGGITLVTTQGEGVSIHPGLLPANHKDDTPPISVDGTSHRPMTLFGAFEGHTSFVRVEVCKSVGVKEGANVLAEGSTRRRPRALRRDCRYKLLGYLRELIEIPQRDSGIEN